MKKIKRHNSFSSNNLIAKNIDSFCYIKNVEFNFADWNNKFCNNSIIPRNNKENKSTNINKIYIEKRHLYSNNINEDKKSNQRNQSANSLKQKINKSKSINRIVNIKKKNKDNNNIHNIKQINIKKKNYFLENEKNQVEPYYNPIIRYKKNKEMINNNKNLINEFFFNLNMNKKINQKLNKNEINSNNNSSNRNKNIDNKEDGSKKLFEKKLKARKNDYNSENNKKTIVKYQIKKEFFQKPNHCKIFDNINLFNSILIMLINNNFIDTFLSDKYEIIKIIEKKNKNCLSSIIYHLDKFVWDSNNNFSDNILLEKYNDFVTYFITSLNTNQKEYFYDIKNIGFIINKIYSGINSEFTQLKVSNYIFNGKDNLSKFINEFIKKHNSIISDHFIGFFRNKINCENCRKINLMNNMKYRHTSQYYPFYCLDFDLATVDDFCNKNNLEYNNIINLDNCFNYLLNEKYKKNYIECDLCLNDTKSQTCSIFTLPNILTIILYNNEKNIFNLQNIINLNKYTINPRNSNYFLISILCINNYTGKFLLYCYNYKTVSWICFTDGKSSKISQIDINSIPLILIYQKGSTINYEYHCLKIEDKLCLFAYYMQNSKLICFPKNCLGKSALEIISKYLNLPRDKIAIYIKANLLEENDLLSNKAKNGDTMLIILKEENLN